MLDRRRFLVASAAASLTASFRRAPAQPRPVLIDSHVHVFERSAAFPYAAGAKPPAQDASPEALIALMNANGVARTVLIQVIHYRWDNRYLAEVLKRYPRLFQGVCRVDPEDPAAPDHLSRLTQEGFRGVRLSPAATAEGDWIRGPLMPPLWRRCSELRVPMNLLVPPSRLPDLVPLLDAHPALSVVIDHMAGCPPGRPDLVQPLLDFARYPNLFVKISGMWEHSTKPYPYPDAQVLVHTLLDRYGAKRLMWATNWPVSLEQLSYADAVALYRDHLPFLNREDREQILSKTVQRIWPFHL